MNRDRVDRDRDPKSEIFVSSNPLPRQQRHSRHGSYSGYASTTDEMSTIPESEVLAFSNEIPGNNRNSLLYGHESVQRSNSPSLFRRITTRLASPRIPSPAALTSPIPLNTFRRRSHGPGYENLGDLDEDQSSVPVDLSLLSGLGFELTEAEQPRSEAPQFSEDTSYQRPQPNGSKLVSQPSQHRTLGDGLMGAAQLKRDPSTRLNEALNGQADEIQRRRTVRDAAQIIAQKRNMIVAMSESVDLSLLEGNVTRRGTTQSFDTLLNSSNMVEQPQSYFFPTDPDIPNWRPWTMSTPYILFLIVGALALAGSQEYLNQKSQRLQGIESGLLAFDNVEQVSVGKFFVWKYLPTMITIIYAVLFSLMDFDIRRLEPFYQLSQPQGSPASESLNVDHLTMFQYFVPFKAMRLKQWTVFFSTIGNIVASTASPALQNPSVNFIQDNDCSGHPDSCKAEVVVIVPVWSRLLSVSYIIVALTGVALFLQLRRKSGLQSDPKGIAGIASMATRSHLLEEFKGTDLATRKDISKRLAHRRFILYRSTIWQGQWSLTEEPERESAKRLSTPHPPMLRLGAAIPFLSAQIFCLIAVALISLTPANVIPNAAPWLPILIATILKLVWTTFEADVRLMEPFYQLSRGNASPESSLTLDYQSTVYGYLPFKAAYNGHWLLCIVGLCSVALDVLSVTVSSFSIPAETFYKTSGDSKEDSDLGVQDQTRVSFWASVSLSLIILTVVIFTTTLVYIRRRHPFLPREPSTIASILAFIYQSNMLEDFIDTEKLSNKEIEDKLKRTGKKYGLGWVRGRDGKIHCAIDQEPITSRYVHGKPYDQALAGPIDYYGADFYA